MRATPYSTVASTIAGACGLAWPLPTEDWDALRRALSHRLRLIWDVGTWPDWTHTEQRDVRPEHDDTETYVLDDEVYSVDQAGYFIAQGAVPAGASILDTAYWEPILLSEVTIDLDQTGQTPMGVILGVWDADPDAGYADTVAYGLRSDDLRLSDFAPNAVWIRYRERPPRLEGDDWQAGATYAVGDQAYYAVSEARGDFYRSLTAGNIGHTPADLGTYWALVPVPEVLESWLIAAGTADWLSSDGQNDKAIGPQREAGAILKALRARYVNDQQQSLTTKVFTH